LARRAGGARDRAPRRVTLVVATDLDPWHLPALRFLHRVLDDLTERDTRGRTEVIFELPFERLRDLLGRSRERKRAELRVIDENLHGLVAGRRHSRNRMPRHDLVRDHGHVLLHGALYER